MRSLLVLGVIALCVLLGTPTTGERTEGGEESSNQRELIGENEGEVSRVLAGSSIGQQARPRSRRQEPPTNSKPRRKKPCIGCFTALREKDPELVYVAPKSRQRRQDSSHPPGGEGKRRGKKNGGKHRAEDPSGPLKPHRGENKRWKNKNGGKHGPEGGYLEGEKRGPHKHNHPHRHRHPHHRQDPEQPMEEKIKAHSGHRSLITSTFPWERNMDGDTKERAGKKKGNSDNRRAGKKEPRYIRLIGSHSPIAIDLPHRELDRKMEILI
ncbi:uncharacterized protein [Pyxicephalus adspersus]|uniref:Uncharacterized protein n=1 Tax=Pyxicephalus adspersus TaxID=30357 RepID=A0AAV3AFM8_PYXAD|nr:TPA: hypothetical protein GDO54_012911 [Pyxicephalus adspersus]